MREYRAFSEAETWKDVEEELQAEAAPNPNPNLLPLPLPLSTTPEQYTARMDDKLNYRYPGVGGESCTPH